MTAWPSGAGRLQVVADVEVSVDGVTSTLTADGSELRLESPDPAELLDALAHADLPSSVGRVDGPHALGRVADQLTSVGLTLTVSGPQGDVLSLGEGAGSWAGRLVTGSPRVRMGSWAAVRPLVGAAVRRRAGARRRPAAAAAGVLAVAAWIVRRRGRRPGATGS